jgi:hypothetical protein
MPKPKLITNTRMNAVCVHTTDCQHTGRYFTERGRTVCADCLAVRKDGKWTANARWAA